MSEAPEPTRSARDRGERGVASAPERPGLDTPILAQLPARFGKFVLERRLARGGMADVYLARLPGAAGFEKELVAKLIRPELSEDEAFVRRFVDEAKTSVRLAHPNIVSIFELGVEHGVLYMVMELVRGVTLAELLQACGALRPEEGVYLGLELARALDHAHRRGVVHRDVTPSNVMIDDEGAVKLLDFGIAAPVHGDSGEIFGTPGHMPPEQLAGGRLTPAVDLFALGTVLVEAWTGRAPFRRADARASRSAMAAGPPPLPSIEHPSLAPLDDLVLALLELAPEKRPQHAEDVARRLRAWLRERGLDLDEIARGLARRVGPAAAARQARAEGRPPPPTIKRSPRPTPLAEGTRTFATRGDPEAWTPEATRRLPHGSDPPGIPAIPHEQAHEGTRPIPDEEPREGTRRIETAPPPSAPAPGAPERSLPPPSEPDASPRRAPWWVAALAVAAAAAAWLGRPANERVETPPAVAPSIAAPTSASAAAHAGAVVPSPASVASVVAIASVEGATSASSSALDATASTTQGLAAASPAKIVVVSSPPAAVELDGKALGSTPVTAATSAGEHRLVLRPHGLGETFERRIVAAAGQAVEVKGDFNDEPSILVRRIAPPR